MDFSFGKLSKQEVYNFLLETDKEFPTPLSSKVDIDEYATKISAYSQFSYCMNQGIIIGMISCYTNNPPMAYITNVCVKAEYQKMGIFHKLLNLLILSLHNKDISYIRLEVDNNNLTAQNAYIKNGFTIKDKASPYSMYMEYYLEK